MANPRILFADNDRKFRGIWAALLREEGFDVSETTSVSAAKKALNKGGYDLAILDLRLERDNDPSDESGLQIAEDYQGILPIIILSADPNKKALLWALQGDRRRSNFASVVEKGQGPETLFKEIRKAIPPKVFVSHGHDENATAAVVSFLESGGARPVILKEQARSSQSLLDQFEKHSNVEFAVILVTPDDHGASRNGGELRPRARQNVIFELGFFLAKLGRNRVVALCKEEEVERIELPSNYNGVLYREMKGDWKIELARDLKAVGIELDLV